MSQRRRCPLDSKQSIQKHILFDAPCRVFFFYYCLFFWKTTISHSPLSFSVFLSLFSLFLSVCLRLTVHIVTGQGRQTHKSSCLLVYSTLSNTAVLESEQQPPQQSQIQMVSSHFCCVSCLHKVYYNVRHKSLSSSSAALPKLHSVIFSSSS